MADETRAIDPTKHLNLYQKTKFAADQLAFEKAEKGLSVKIVYPGFGFGCSKASSHPSMQDQTLLRMAAGNPTKIMGSGKNKLLLAYYKDTVSGILKTHENGQRGETYILGNENLNFAEILTTIANLLGKKPPKGKIPLTLLKTIANLSRISSGKFVFPPDFLDMITYNWCFSNQKAKTQLGWQPTSFTNAITETWNEYQNSGWIKK